MHIQGGAEDFKSWKQFWELGTVVSKMSKSSCRKDPMRENAEHVVVISGQLDSPHNFQGEKIYEVLPAAKIPHPVVPKQKKKCLN